MTAFHAARKDQGALTLAHVTRLALIDDQATGNVTVNGGGTVKLGGAMYFPHVDVSWGGTAANSFTTCSMVIAKTLTINGNAYMSTDGCDQNTIAKTQVVALVQ